MKSLKQRQLLKQQQYTLTPSSLLYQVNTPGQSQSFDISFEHIYKVVLNDRKSRIEHLFLGILMLGLGVASYFDAHVATGLQRVLEYSMMGGGLLTILFYFFGATAYQKVKIADNQYLVLKKHGPDAATVQAFLDDLFEQRDAYLIAEYGTVNTRLTYNYQLEQFKRLHRLKVWTTSEFKAKCEELESMHRLMDMGFDLSSKVNQN